MLFNYDMEISIADRRARVSEIRGSTGEGLSLIMSFESYASAVIGIAVAGKPSSS